MDLWEIVRIVRRAGYLMAESLWEYWPSEKNNDIPESNIGFSFAIAFHESRFKCFSNCNWKGCTDKRMDFFAISPKENVVVCAEFKKLFNAEQLQKMTEDVSRIKSFSPLEDCGKYKPNFGIIAATTFKTDIVKWWSASKSPTPTNHKNWNRISKKLENAYWGNVPLNTYDEETTVEQTELHYLLYSVFKMS